MTSIDRMLSKEGIDIKLPTFRHVWGEEVAILGMDYIGYDLDDTESSKVSYKGDLTTESIPSDDRVMNPIQMREILCE